MMMMIANLVGFVVGVDGIQFFLKQLFGTAEGKFAKIMSSRVKLSTIISGLRFLFLACVVLFIDNQVLFEYRYVLVSLSMNLDILHEIQGGRDAKWNIPKMLAPW